MVDLGASLYRELFLARRTQRGALVGTEDVLEHPAARPEVLQLFF